MIPSCLVTYGVSSVPSWLASMIVPSYLSSQSVQHVDLQGLQTFRLSDFQTEVAEVSSVSSGSRTISSKEGRTRLQSSSTFLL